MSFCQGDCRFCLTVEYSNVCVCVRLDIEFPKVQNYFAVVSVYMQIFVSGLRGLYDVTLIEIQSFSKDVVRCLNHFCHLTEIFNETIL